MDLIKSLNLEELPEQQTRTLHLIEKYPDFDLSLGFDSCCSCGKTLGTDCPALACKNCKRVMYCSDACRHLDANVPLPELSNAEEEGGGETALGHTAVVCAVLRTCEDDEAVEANEIDNLDPSRLQAAKDRIQSEKESYPATLANVLAEGPCYKETLERCSERRSLIIHIIGASTESELWDTTEEDRSFGNAYAEALADLAAINQLDIIRLVFVGPECPEQSIQLSVQIQSLEKDRPSSSLVVQTFRGDYKNDLLSQNALSKPDIVVFFNPGFTVPEYQWTETLSCIDKGTPFLSTTNTELEGIADCQYLIDQDRIQSVPPGLADMFGVYCRDEDACNENAEELSFFSDNPFCGNRVRQNGKMANDLFVKNHWILGGIVDSFDPSKGATDSPAKRQKSSSSTNNKTGNPALI